MPYIGTNGRGMDTRGVSPVWIPCYVTVPGPKEIDRWIIRPNQEEYGYRQLYRY
jgi:hypothetical protein